MTDNEQTARIEALESRLMHQEAALDELTRTLLTQEQRFAELVETVRHLEAQLRALAPAGRTRPEDETPPHY